MTVHVWKTIALTTALLGWGAAVQAQTVGGSTGGGQGAVAQTRPAPVTGRVGADPAAVALRPAGQAPLTSTAKQVAPPLNPNEPLLAPETLRVNASSLTPTQRAEPVTTPPSKHVDRTRGVHKPSQAMPHQRAQKTKGTPHHAAHKASAVEPKDPHGAGKKGDKKSDKKIDKKSGKTGIQPSRHVGAQGSGKAGKTAGVTAKLHGKAGQGAARSHRLGTHAGGVPAVQTKQPTHAGKPLAGATASKAHPAHAGAKASAPVVKKPVPRKHSHA